jgi:thiol-disulfide isomerase/thioredoxin
LKYQGKKGASKPLFFLMNRAVLSGFVFVLMLGMSCSTVSRKPDDRDGAAVTIPSGLKNLHGAKIDLSLNEKGKARVFFFLSPECPLCQSYVPLLRELGIRYSPKGFYLYAVFPGKLYTSAEIEEFLKNSKLDLPEIMDPDLILTRSLGASVTPEAVVLNPQGKSLYRGRIDDLAWEVGQKRIKATTHDLENALEGIEIGQFSFVRKTQAVGCFIEK